MDGMPVNCSNLSGFPADKLVVPILLWLDGERHFDSQVPCLGTQLRMALARARSGTARSRFLQRLHMPSLFLDIPKLQDLLTNLIRCHCGIKACQWTTFVAFVGALVVLLSLCRQGLRQCGHTPLSICKSNNAIIKSYTVNF